MYHFYNKKSDEYEECLNVEVSSDLTSDEQQTLKQVLADGFDVSDVQVESSLSSEGTIVEIGPRLNFATAFSTNAVSICHSVGLDKVTRIEKFKRYVLPAGVDETTFIQENADRMTETTYPDGLESFDIDIKPEEVYEVPILEEGVDALKKMNKEMGLGMDDWDVEFYYNMFKDDFKRNPTNVECFQLGQANSEHSRHWYFNAKLIVDGKEAPTTLFKMVKEPIKHSNQNSTVAFKDNSSAMEGAKITSLLPQKPGKSSPLEEKDLNYDLTLTAETHNFPSGVAPFPGAETGTGGRIRDGYATGKGSLVLAGTAAYCVGNLNIPGYPLPWENKDFTYPDNLVSPLKIMIDASNGASDYGNKFGEPVIQGFVRSYGLDLPNGERREWLKPIMFTGGVGQMDAQHREKDAAEKGMLIVQIGGPAYRIGVGGGAASSMIQGENAAELDFNAVQRGDAEMEQKVNRVIRACIEMGDSNPILSIHDQGAGGPCNVLTEIVEPAGGRVEIRDIKVGDKTMSVLEIWSAEYQERGAVLIRPEHKQLFADMCERERVNCEFLGEVTGDGKIVVHDRENDTDPVDLELSKILGEMPQKTFEDTSADQKLEALEIPTGLSFEDALENVLKLPSVGSKRFLTSKVDRSVTGLIVQQQCCGPTQLPVADVAVTAQSHFNTTGTAISIGEQPIKGLVDAQAGARMAVGEALTNIVWAKIGDLKNIKSSANWMWAAKLPGEGASMYKAAGAMRDIMIDLGIAIDGGKDSLSMATKVGSDVVKSPGELTISAYADVPDITKVVTPDIKQPGKSSLYVIDLGTGKDRLGGSAFAHTLGQIGNDTPDVDDVKVLERAFKAVQEMVDKGIILSGHDRSDGGLITSVLEMAFAGNCGINLSVAAEDALAYYFNEELGLVVEVANTDEGQFNKVVNEHDLEEITQKLGETTEEKTVVIRSGDEQILDSSMQNLREMWEETSHQLNKLQTNEQMALEEKESIRDMQTLPYVVPFTPEKTPEDVLNARDKVKVAVIREEGSNGDREMTSALHQAGFEAWDVTMFDLSNGVVNLDDFRGIVFVGGFSYADVLGSAKGWASSIRFNEKLRTMFDSFYDRSDTFSLGVCNGCQLMGLLGWVPYRDLADDVQPRFVRNSSERFESRWVNVKIGKSPAVMLSGMEDATLGVWVAHGEGRLASSDAAIMNEINDKDLAPIRYVDDMGEATMKYPFNPNGSPDAIAGLCSPDGRHLAMMPHPERAFLKWQWPWWPEGMEDSLEASPWLTMFQNARKWCERNN